MNGLVDYNSSSSDEEEHKLKPKQKINKSVTKIFIQPLPKNVSTPTSTDQAKKIVNSKRPATSGLASLLPPPKRTQPIQPNQIINHQSEQQSQQQTTDNHQSNDFNLTNSNLVNQSASQTSTSALDLFGLPNLTSLPHVSSSTNQSTSSLITVSSAPQVAEEVPPEPNLLDPYPGYWQRRDGTWVQRDPNDPIWKEFYLKHYDPSTFENQNHHAENQLPKDFFKDEPNSNMVEFNAKKEAQLAWENKPKIINPRLEARQEQANSKPAAKYISARARGRHQLTSLLTEAQANRAELEDRIAHGKSNRKAGGAKYGF